MRGPAGPQDARKPPVRRAHDLHALEGMGNARDTARSRLLAVRIHGLEEALDEVPPDGLAADEEEALRRQLEQVRRSIRRHGRVTAEDERRVREVAERVVRATRVAPRRVHGVGPWLLGSGTGS